MPEGYLSPHVALVAAGVAPAIVVCAELSPLRSEASSVSLLPNHPLPLCSAPIAWPLSPGPYRLAPIAWHVPLAVSIFQPLHIIHINNTHRKLEP